jgi:SNF2 family DNA or RNA helicase
MQQRGPNGEVISEVQFSCDIVSDESFSITLTPPDPAAIELLRAEHGVVDEKAASLSSYHRENPTTWIFNLQQHDQLMKTLETSRDQHKRNWKIIPIPVSARTLLLKDLQTIRLASYAAQHAAPESAAAHAISSQLAPSPVFAPGASSPVISSRTSHVDSDFEEDEPKTKKKKKGGGTLLAPKHHRVSEATAVMQKKADAARHLTIEEETSLNEQKLPPHLRVVLLPFQLEGVQYLVSRGGRGLLADEMVN